MSKALSTVVSGGKHSGSQRASSPRVRQRRQFWLLTALLLGLFVVESLGTRFLQPLDHWVGDRWLRQHAQSRPPPPHVVIVDLDQASLQDPVMMEVGGRWPWPRLIHGELLDYLAQHQPKAVVLDLLFTEPDVFQPQSDVLFVQALQRHRAYVPMLLIPRGAPATAPLAQAPPAMGILPTPQAQPDAKAAISAPTALPPEVWFTGNIRLQADADGVARRYAVGHNVHGWWVPSMAGRLANDLGWPMPASGEIRLNWYGHGFEHVSYAALYKTAQQSDEAARAPLPSFKDAIVIITATAPGLMDFHAISLGPDVPGGWILATAVANLRDGQGLTDAPPWTHALLVSLLLGWTAWQLRERTAAVWLKLGLGLGAAGTLALLVSRAGVAYGVYWVPASSLVLAAVGLLVLALWSLRSSDRQRRQVQEAFGSFLDPRVVDLLLEGEPLTANRNVTILFSDIRNFTTLCEGRAPQDVMNLLNTYFEQQVSIIRRHGGLLDKFIGDAIMAFWNAPQEQPDSAVAAVEAALEMGDALQAIRQAPGLAGLADGLEIGIGIHTGTATVGILGSAHSRSYTVIGDAVNLSSRIEGCTKGVARILVSEDTRRACGERFAFVDRGEFAVKGRVQTVRLYEPQRWSTQVVHREE